MNWHKREQKNEVRPYIFSNKKSSNFYLTLPGSDCVDIEVGIKQGVINSQTKIIGIENDFEAFLSAKKWKERNQDLNFDLVYSNLEDYKMVKSADIVFLDFLGNFTGKTALWVKDNLKLADNADVSITVSTIIRNNSFIIECIKLFKTKSFWKSYEYKLKELGYNCVDLLTTYCILFDHFFFFKNNKNIINIEPYKDTSSMFFIKIENVQKVSCSTSLVKEIEEIAMSKKTTGKSKFSVSRKIPTFLEVVFLGLEANSPGKKAVFTKNKQRYVNNKVEKGHKENRIIAAIKARITRERLTMK